MWFPPEFLDELRQRTRLSDVIARKVQLTRRGREHVGLCPFHKEKTPSFTVVDEKGFYHCFGCGAHGDAMRFLMESDGLPFNEAVNKLAGEAGMPIPQPSEQDRRRAEKRAGLYDITEAAAKWFESQLAGSGGEEARRYLAGRGLTRETIGLFRLGLAPNRRTALKEALLARGMPEAKLIEAGLVIERDEGENVDRFRNRVIFPITDSQDRVIAFGARALGQARAKYLNSPETPLFRKGYLVYNLPRARRAALDSGELILVEGYMDTVALTQAGFPQTVAPLGTALTEEQLRLLWRFADEPVICFDGDEAGQRAAYRAAERALPLLEPGKSLRFIKLPEGEDPDSLVRRNDPAAFAKLLTGAEPLAELLWRALASHASVSTPERRTGLEDKVFRSLGAIRNERVRQAYGRDFRRRLNAFFDRTDRTAGGRQFPTQRGRRWPSSDHKAKRASWLKNTALGQTAGENAVKNRIETLLLLVMLSHPALLEDHHEELAGLSFHDAALEKMRGAISEYAANGQPLDAEPLKNHLLEKGFGTLYTRIAEADALRADWFAWPSASPIDAEKGWLHMVARYRLIQTLEEDLAEIKREMEQNSTEEAFERLKAVREELNNATGLQADIEGYGIASERRPTT